MIKNDRFFCEPSRLYTRTPNPAAHDVSSIEKKVTAEPSRAEPSRAEPSERARAGGECGSLPCGRAAVRAARSYLRCGARSEHKQRKRERKELIIETTEKERRRRSGALRTPWNEPPPAHAPPVPLVFMKRSARVCALCVCSCACRVRVCAHARVCVRVCVAAGARGCERVGLCMSP